MGRKAQKQTAGGGLTPEQLQMMQEMLAEAAVSRIRTLRDQAITGELGKEEAAELHKYMQLFDLSMNAHQDEQGKSLLNGLDISLMDIGMHSNDS